MKNTIIKLNHKCPYCKSTNTIIDKNKMEIICQDCYTILSQPYNYVGGRKVISSLPSDYYTQQKGINTPSGEYKIPGSKITKYKHHRRDKQLMFLGHKDHYNKNLIKT
jgi:ribosomal protein S27E